MNIDRMVGTGLDSNPVYACDATLHFAESEQGNDGYTVYVGMTGIRKTPEVSITKKH